MSGPDDVPVEAPAPAAQPSPGMLVREARAAAGLSIDDVAQQLKLAPRQVLSLENDDYEHLPGRTFVRGFLRNYARLLGLDANALLAALPDGRTASLDRPAISPTTRVMGELPADAQSRAGHARWAIPLAFVALVAIAAAYMWRPGGERARSTVTGAPVEQALPAATPASPAVVEAPSTTGSAPGTSTSATPLVTDAGTLPAATADAAPQANPVAPAATADDTPLVLVFRGTSWIEVKDARGNVLLSTMGYPGATHSVGGILPFDVVLGNAEAVQVSLRGEAFDTTPYVKQNVAKFQVK